MLGKAVVEITHRKLGGALGAEIRGVDLTRSPLPSETVRRLRELLGEHLALVFRHPSNSRLKPSQQIAFTTHFGT